MGDWLRNTARRVDRYVTGWQLLEDLTIAVSIWIVVVEILHLPFWAALIGALIAGALRGPVTDYIRRRSRNATNQRALIAYKYLAAHKETETDMGWSDGNDVFNPTITALLRIGLDGDNLYRSAYALIAALQAQDWDTESESFDEFRTHLPIVAAFYNNEVNQYVNETDDAYLDYDPDRNEWRLTCNGCDSKVIATAPFTVEGHDHLLNVWSFHDVSVHGGDGKLDWPDMFLTPSPDEGPALLTFQVLDGLVVSFPRGWSVEGCDGTDPDRFVVEFTRPAPADHPDIIRATAADVAMVAAVTGPVPGTVVDVALDDEEDSA